MEGYTNTILIDTSRRQSEEFKSGNLSSNNSDYTCKIGAGVKLEQGDKVSVNAGYLSRRGAGSDTIELTGRETGKTISLKKLTKNNHQKMIRPHTYNGLNIPSSNYGQVAEVFGCQVYEETTQEYPIKDNEVHFNISYYKTTNGEGYFHLPRRFDAQKTQFHDDTDVGPTYKNQWIGLWHPSFNKETECAYAYNWADGNTIDPDFLSVRPPFDCYRMGMSYGGYYPTGYNVVNPGAGNFGLMLAYNHIYRRCPDDMYFYQTGQSQFIYGPNAGGGTGAGEKPGTFPPDKVPINGGGAAGTRSDLLSFVWKKKNDNARYTAFQKEVSYFASREPRQWFMPDIQNLQAKRIDADFSTAFPGFVVSDNTFTTIPNNSLSRYDYQSVDDQSTLLGTHLYLEMRDPAQSEYVLYQETKKLSVEPGNYSPPDLASLLTDQLTKTKAPEYIVGAVASRGYPRSVSGGQPNPLQPVGGNDVTPNSQNNFTSKQVIVSTTTESETHKPFHAATSVSIERKAFLDFKTGDSLIYGDPSYHFAREITSTNYLSSYQTIGFKRPELYLAGKKVMSELGYRHLGHDDSFYNTTQSIILNSPGATAPIPQGSVVSSLITADRQPAGIIGKTIKAVAVGETEIEIENPADQPQFTIDTLSGLTEAQGDRPWYISDPSLSGAYVVYFIDRAPGVASVNNRQQGYPHTGNFSKYNEFVWNTQRPATFDGDTAPPLHGGKIYEDTEERRLAGVVGKVQGWSWKQIHNPFIVTAIHRNSSPPVKSVTLSYHWTKENLDGLKEFFDTQGKYPELFEGIVLPKNPPDDVTGEPYTINDSINVNTNRFLHINHRDSSSHTNAGAWKNSLGTDFYYADDINPGATGNAEGYNDRWGTDVFFFDFDKDRKDVASGGNDYTDKYYGLFIKKQGTNPYNNQTEDFIAIDTTLMGGIPDYYYEGHTPGGATPGTGGTIISAACNRTIGFDMHFCAYGNSAIGLYAGYLSGQIKTLDATNKTSGLSAFIFGATQSTGSAAPEPTDETPCLGYPIAAPAQEITGAFQGALGTTFGTGDPTPYSTQDLINGQKPVHQYLKYRYLGAENPGIVFDPSESKFSFAQLHSPERVGNINNAGSGAALPIAADTSNPVYYVNKRLLLREYCPDMFPYSKLTASEVPLNQGQLTTYSSYFNNNITPFSIMDAISGIFIEDFGYSNLTDEDWNLSLWAMMGFTRSQFNSSDQILSRQTRINNTITTDNIGKPTTNANVEPSELSQLITNKFGAELRTGQIPAIMGSNDVDPDKMETDFKYELSLQFLPGATITQKSAQINAEELPIKTRQPYLLIKSDIISDTKYLGSNDSGVSLPVISVVNKDNASTDFFFGSAQQEFTITNPKTITSIRTQVLNPDGSLSKLDSDTSVIYKVVKQSKASLGVAEQMMQEAQKSQKKKK